MHLVYGVTTYNRLGMLKQNLESWDRTRNKRYKWTLIVCDDGSTDGSQEYIKGLQFQNVDIVRFFNNRIGIGPQINCILEESKRLRYNLAFRSDDDVEFIQAGWDDLYLNAVKASRFGFLCFFDAEWAKKYRDPKIVLSHPAKDEFQRVQCCVTHIHDGMGAFFTYTPKVLASVGYMDEAGIGIWGSEHTDYAVRCARINQTGRRYLWDALGSEKYLRLIDTGYVSSITEQEKTKAQEYCPDAQSKWSLITSPRRIYVPYKKSVFNMVGERR